MLRPCFLALLCAGLCVASSMIVPAANLEPAPYADWAHKHWVWLSSSQANQTSSTQLVEDYLAYDIPVGAIDLDSEWATGNNDFVWNTQRYPTPAPMIQHFHDLGVKVILWATSMIDSDSPNFAEGKAKGYMLNDAQLIKWWHGHGALLDYTNPEALAWWHTAMDNVLDMGVDGFKCDGTDPYVFELIIARGKGGVITEREYADAYYGDFFDYTRQKRGPEGLIMSRPVDAYWSFSPRRVVFSGWVGDQDPTFDGLKSALTNIMHSAWRKYVGFGSDIGGYRCCGPEPFGRTVELFTRWFQVGAFHPLMENGGDNEHRPWKFDTTNVTVNTYRIFANIHTELVSYLLSAGTYAYYNNESIIHPMAIDLGPVPIENFDYKLGSDIFVAPMTVENSTERQIKFPDHDNWVDWWNPKQVYQGGSETKYNCPLNIFPVFHRQGSILPLDVTNHHAGHGDKTSAQHLTALISHPVDGEHQTNVHESNGNGRTIGYTYHAGKLSIVASAHKKPLIVLVRGVDCTAVESQATHVKSFAELSQMSAGVFCDAEVEELWVRPGSSTMGNHFTLHNVHRLY